MKTEIIKDQKIKCYDNKGKTLDRYTILYLSFPVNPNYNPCYNIYKGRTISECLKISEYLEATQGSHFGKRIAFDKLPTNCKKIVLHDMNSLQMECLREYHKIYRSVYKLE